MRRLVLAGNWKMNKTSDETTSFIEGFCAATGSRTNVDIVLATPYTSLATAAKALAGTGIGLAAQNMHWEHSGAFTGEVSAEMLLDAGCTHVIIAHSERRQYFGETNETASKKLVAAHDAGLAPIYCVGETLDQRESGHTSDTIVTQTREGLTGLNQDQIRATMLAYEPVWAIGTGRTASPDQAQEVHALMRETLAHMYDVATAESVRILYGGSAKPDNVAELVGKSDVDGALVGGASLEVAAFAKMAAIVEGIG